MYCCCVLSSWRHRENNCTSYNKQADSIEGHGANWEARDHRHSPHSDNNRICCTWEPEWNYLPANHHLHCRRRHHTISAKDISGKAWKKPGCFYIDIWQKLLIEAFDWHLFIYFLNFFLQYSLNSRQEVRLSFSLIWKTLSLFQWVYIYMNTTCDKKHNFCLDPLSCLCYCPVHGGRSTPSQSFLQWHFFLKVSITLKKTDDHCAIARARMRHVDLIIFHHHIILWRYEFYISCHGICWLFNFSY